MKTSHSVYIPEAGVDVGVDVQLVVSSDEPTKLLFKGGSAFMVTKEDLLKAIEVLEMHLNLAKPITYMVQSGTHVVNIESGITNQIK